MQDVTIIEGRPVAEGKTRVAIISARFNGFIVEALEAGAKGYLLKSAHIKEVITAIKAVHNNGTYFSKEIAPFSLFLMTDHCSIVFSLA